MMRVYPTRETYEKESYDFLYQKKKRREIIIAILLMLGSIVLALILWKQMAGAAVLAFVPLTGFKKFMHNNLLEIGFIIFLVVLLLIAFNSPGFYAALFSLFQ